MFAHTALLVDLRSEKIQEVSNPNVIKLHGRYPNIALKSRESDRLETDWKPTLSASWAGSSKF